MQATFAFTRSEALVQLSAFEKIVGTYDFRRNFVSPSHDNVSCLSPAIRHRLVSEYEVIDYVLARNEFQTVEKFVQEVYWRRYWKGWLSLRPFVWDQYREYLAENECPVEAQEMMKGEGEVALMNHWAKELVDSGYLHNHARMWFAAYWVHQLGLPWQWGADFFYTHLLDADPASNTLSWRWVAGLQTKGKRYLARESNIRKFTDKNILKGLEGGLGLLDGTREYIATDAEYNAMNEGVISFKLPTVGRRVCGQVSGYWLHDEDLTADLKFLTDEDSCVLLTYDQKSSETVGYSDKKKEWLLAACVSTFQRVTASYTSREVEFIKSEDLVCDLVSWAERANLEQIVTVRPEAGYLNDQLSEVIRSCSELGVAVVVMDDDRDECLRPMAKAGFFNYWKKVQKSLK